MSSSGEPPDRRKRPIRDGRPPRKKYPSGEINYKKRRKPDARPVIRVLDERFGEWESLKRLLHHGDDMTHASTFCWLLEAARDALQYLKRTRVVDAAALLS